jgi:tRNA dimethylallyltransferase
VINVAINDMKNPEKEERTTALLEDAILIAGPTASGKSGLALQLAQQLDGVVVNSDSMQVYDVLRVITARPGEDDLARAPHLLYGHVDPAHSHSTGAWLREVEALSATGAFAGRRVIFVGGTGLYFRALLQGLSAMPDVPAPIRARWRQRHEEEGAPALHELLVAIDPASAARILPQDGQRIVRALEVHEATGRSLSSHQAPPGQGLVDPGSAIRIILTPERGELVARIERRLDAMVEEGALDEVSALLARGLDPALPAMKAIGVRELGAHLDGEISLDTAVERAKAATRQYAKRQATWFRHQAGSDWHRFQSHLDAAKFFTS